MRLSTAALFLFVLGVGGFAQVSLAGHPIFSPASPEPVLPRGEPQRRPRSRTLRSLSARLTRLRPSAGWPILFEVRRRGRPPAAPPPHRRPRAPVPPADPGQQLIYTPLPTLASTIPSIFTSSNPPFTHPCASRASHPLTPRPTSRMVESGSSCVSVASLVHILIITA